MQKPIDQLVNEVNEQDLNFRLNMLAKGARLDLVKLPESGLSRIWRYALGPERVPFAMISAYRKGKTRAENKQNTARLMSQIQRFGPTQVIGHYPEDLEDPKLKDKTEISFFVPCSNMMEDQFRNMMQSLCGQFNQDSVLYSDGQSIGFLERSGSFQPAFSKMSASPASVKDYWSMIRGRRFVMIESAVYTSSQLSGWGLVKTTGLTSDMNNENLRQYYERHQTSGALQELNS